jgi:DNA-binding Xre family transcriptional regulator
MLGRICEALDAQPGQWFRRDGDTLVWNIRDVAEGQGMTMNDLIWTAAILPPSLVLIWRGAQQFVFLETLGKLARALGLDIGDLFEWQVIGHEE